MKKTMDERMAEFLQYIIKNPKSTQATLGEVFNVHKSTVKAVMLRLEQEDVISETIRSTKYYSARMEKHGVRQPDIMQHLFAHRWENDVSAKDMHVMR